MGTSKLTVYLQEDVYRFIKRYMNITYLIGNGFDIKLGLRNRYIDFYKSYVAMPSESDPLVVKTFKAEINDFIKKELNKEDTEVDWRDLEVALGKYTSKVSLEEFETLYFDIIEHLKSYLTAEYEYFDARYIQSEDFLKYLADPITTFFNNDQQRVLYQYVRSFSNEDVINIINFNYTPTLEHLSGFEGKELPIGKSVSGRAAKLYSIRHIHQTLFDEDILVGVNDKSQIENPEYTKNIDVCELLIKPSTNKVLGSGVDSECESIINNTNLFVLFGTSAGITDSKWWWLICNRMMSATASHARLLYFVYLPDSVPHQGVRYGRLSRADIRRFVKSAGLDENVYNAILPNIYVSYTPDMFRLSELQNVLNIPPEIGHQYTTAKVKVTLLKETMRYVVVRVDAPQKSYGVDMEYGWIKDVFPGYTAGPQVLLDIEVNEVKIPFDRITISNGANRKDIYFDISSFYGKPAIPGRVDVDNEILKQIEKLILS